MRYFILLCSTLVLFILLISTVPLETGPVSATPDKKQGFSGTYSITVTLKGGQKYSTRIGIQDLKNGTVKITGAYDGIPVTVIGKTVGNTADGSIVCRFSGKIGKLFSGNAKIVITQKGDDYYLTGTGSGSYSYQGCSGKGSGIAAGKRTAKELPVFGLAAAANLIANPLHFSGLSKIFPLLMLILGAVLISKTIRKRNPVG